MTEQKSNGVQQKLDELSPRKSIDTKPNGERFHYILQSFCQITVMF